MNTIKKCYIKENSIESKPFFVKFISKSKYRRMSQPGLFRYNMSRQDVGYEFYDSSLTYGSNGEILISKLPVIEVDDNIAMCFVSIYK
jgi:hypothetical protein